MTIHIEMETSYQCVLLKVLYIIHHDLESIAIK
jgi:hypothetical protein